MVTVRVREAKTHLSALLARVESGEQIVVARGNREVAQIIPLRPVKPGRRELGFVAYQVPESFFDALPAPGAGTAAG